MHITQVIGEVHLHARMCTPIFRRSGTVGQIALKCGAWLDVNPYPMSHDPCQIEKEWLAGCGLRRVNYSGNSFVFDYIDCIFIVYCIVFPLH